jgi:hypothetical protein
VTGGACQQPTGTKKFVDVDVPEVHLCHICTEENEAVASSHALDPLDDRADEVRRERVANFEADVEALQV